MKKQVIAYTHFHWDREWYKEYETFRYRLIKSFDIVLDMLVSNKLPSFYFDGQTSALLDYLEIRPQKKELVKSLIKDKRLFIGPFYCLVDEFLTSKEVFTKNLEIGLKTSEEFGCSDFLAYFADTFGHSACTIPILKEFGINKAVVWRGCGDIPANFTWQYKNNSIKTVNLVRGYFNDIFATKQTIEQKTAFLKSNLDKIAEKSGNVLLLPIGADHLAVPKDLETQVSNVNSLLDDYEIVLGSPFDYFEKTDEMFEKFVHNGELRDNSKTFILEGCYSSRLDIKRLNIIASHQLKLANKICELEPTSNMKNLVEYAYKLLIQNQAHDSICGCSTDDVHKENIIRYKKTLQISNSIIDDYKLTHKSDELQILNLGRENYTGSLNYWSEKDYDYPIVDTKNGFPADIFNDIYKIPITEDYTTLNNYVVNCKNQKFGLNNIEINPQEDVFVSETSLGNSKIFLQIKDNNLYVGKNKISLVDYVDLGDSYNYGPKVDDLGTKYTISSSEIVVNDPRFSSLRVRFKKERNNAKSNFAQNDSISLTASLSADNDKIKIEVNWVNTEKNHLLQMCVDTIEPIFTTNSEDLGEIITREFNPNYDVRGNLPQERGIEVMMNNAPMQRGVCANGVVVVTEGITQYEVAKNELRLPLLRATGVISNALNTARTTPAGPPIEVDDLQQIGLNSQSLWIAFGHDLRQYIDDIYNECIVF